MNQSLQLVSSPDMSVESLTALRERPAPEVELAISGGDDLASYIAGAARMGTLIGSPRYPEDPDAACRGGRRAGV